MSQMTDLCCSDLLRKKIVVSQGISVVVWYPTTTGIPAAERIYEGARKLWASLCDICDHLCHRCFNSVCANQIPSMPGRLFHLCHHVHLCHRLYQRMDQKSRLTSTEKVHRPSRKPRATSNRTRSKRISVPRPTEGCQPSRSGTSS